MSIHDIANISSAGIGIMILGLIFFRLFPRARREALQQDLFKLRNDLFIFMWENKFDMQDPAYLEMRATLNGSIRHAESLHIPHLIFCVLCNLGSEPPKRERTTAGNGILQKKIGEVREKYATRVTFHFVTTPLGILSMPIFFILAGMDFIVRAWKKKQSEKPKEPMVVNYRWVRAFEYESQRCERDYVYALAVGSRPNPRNRCVVHAH